MDLTTIRKVTEENCEEIAQEFGWEDFKKFIDELELSEEELMGCFVDWNQDEAPEDFPAHCYPKIENLFSFMGGGGGHHYSYNFQETMVAMDPLRPTIAYISYDTYERIFL